ncbi:hypothetical protein PR048_024844 [Dryococelus australis]|uniref:Integrase catalytic domain-containing protein n=1 Tax=Dryococelus australis TaxID=614101 RepID=A0ABQ9GPS5_9NEOP|nr:hypothetical protein PR048_024844 [Dryococelus australis]
MEILKKLCNEPELRKFFQIYKLLSIQECCLMYGNRIVIPGQLKNKILSITRADHVGITRCELMAISYVWWFGMNDDIEMKFLNVLVPSIIVSDNGPPFNSNGFSANCQDRFIKVIKITPYNPRSNGLAERQVRTFKKSLIKIVLSNVGLSSLTNVNQCLFSLMSTSSSVTGVSPMSQCLIHMCSWG